jgi:hypothetical protein
VRPESRLIVMGSDATVTASMLIKRRIKLPSRSRVPRVSSIIANVIIAWWFFTAVRGELS